MSERLTISYVSNLSSENSSGGGGGVNNRTISELSKSFELQIFTPPLPPASTFEGGISKIKKLVNLPRDFYFFSEYRLSKIASLLESQHYENSDYIFFHGATSWIKLHPSRPYGVHIDACFQTYLNIYHPQEQFSPTDVNRIVEQEKFFLQNAEHVFFRSKWALDETTKLYQIPGSNFHATGRGGAIEIPSIHDIENSSSTPTYFLFIALDFLGKGGDICVKALDLVRDRYPDAKLLVVGAPPPKEFSGIHGLQYLGKYNKSIPEQLNQFQSLIANARALIHPTQKDTNPLIISEAGYYGIPSVASDKYGIKDLIKHGETGFLLSDPKNPKELSKYMMEVWEMRNDQYLNMKKATRSFHLQHFTWEAVGKKMTSLIKTTLSK